MLRGTLFIIIFVMNLTIWAAAYFGLNFSLPESMRESLTPYDLVLYFCGIGALFSTLPVIRWMSDEEHPRWWFWAGIWGALVFPIAGAVVQVVRGHSDVKTPFYADTFAPLFAFLDKAGAGLSKYVAFSPAGFLVGLVAAALTVWISRGMRGMTTRA